ncbi:MAG: hypothetical protein IKS09_04155 [Lachnospiraceae bacterium]|nr:hypothetical protein [Lachnospiraceae bacterium]
MKEFKSFVAFSLIFIMFFNLTACGKTVGKNTEDDRNLFVGTALQEPNYLTQIFEKLTDPDSSYSKTKAMDTYTTYSEKVEGNRLVITAKGEYINGTYEFALDGDYLVYTGEFDYFLTVIMSDICDAAADLYGMDKTLVNGLLKAVSNSGLSSKDVIVEMDESGENIVIKINVAGAYDFSSLESIYIDDEAVSGSLEPLTENGIGGMIGAGKINVLYNGSKDSLDICVSEYGGRTDLTYKSLMSVVKALKPDGYEKFISEYVSLTEVETDDYQVTFTDDKMQSEEAFYELEDGHKFVKVHFGIIYDENGEYYSEEDYSDEDYSDEDYSDDDYTDDDYAEETGEENN